MEVLNITPSVLETIIFYLLPGFVLIFLFYYQIPDRKKSDLNLVVWSVVASSVINWIVISIYNLINFLSNLKLKFVVDNTYFPIAKICLSLICAYILAKIVKCKWFSKANKKIFDINVYPFGRLWNDFFHLPENSVAKIFLNNGLCYIGTIKRTSVDPNDSIQEIELWRPLYYDSKTHNQTPISETQSVLIQSQSVTSIELIDPTQAKLLYPGLES